MTYLLDRGVPALSNVTRYVPFEPDKQDLRQHLRGSYLPEGWIMYVEWRPNPGWTRRWGAGPEDVSLWVRDVVSASRSEIRKQLFEAGMPRLIEWLQQAASNGEGWKLLRHRPRHAWAWVDGRLIDDEIETHLLRD